MKQLALDLIPEAIQVGLHINVAQVSFNLIQFNYYFFKTFLLSLILFRIFYLFEKLIQSI